MTLSSPSCTSHSTSDPITITATDFVTLSLISHFTLKLRSAERLQKLMFLIDEELPTDLSLYDYEHQAHGPHAPALQQRLEQLDKHGYITIHESTTYGGDTRYSYSLTKTGQRIVSLRLDSDPKYEQIHQHTRNVFDKYGNAPVSNLIGYVCETHPEYQDNAIFW